MKSNLLYSVVNHLFSSNHHPAPLLWQKERSKCSFADLQRSEASSYPLPVTFKLPLSFFFLSLSEFFFIFVKHPHILFPLLLSRIFFILVDIRTVKSYISPPFLFRFCLTNITTSFQIYHSPPQFFVRRVLIFATFIAWRLLAWIASWINCNMAG